MENKNHLSLAEQKELVDYAFEKSRKQMWYLFKIMLVVIPMVIVLVFGAVFLSVNFLSK